jgi:peptidoglycan/xylan/chitin deacetylase (PgdA/CDA1 family)
MADSSAVALAKKDQSAVALAKADDPWRMLTPSAIAEMVASGLIEFGAHGEEHYILSTLDPAARRRQIERSIANVERLTGRPCRLFAYPNGRRRDYGPPDLQVLRECGIAAAVTTEEIPNRPDTPPLELGRYGIHEGLSLAHFQMLVHHTVALLRGRGAPKSGY